MVAHSYRFPTPPIVLTLVERVEHDIYSISYKSDHNTQR